MILRLYFQPPKAKVLRVWNQVWHKHFASAVETRLSCEHSVCLFSLFLLMSHFVQHILSTYHFLFISSCCFQFKTTGIGHHRSSVTLGEEKLIFRIYLCKEILLPSTHLILIFLFRLTHLQFHSSLLDVKYRYKRNS